MNKAERAEVLWRKSFSTQDNGLIERANRLITEYNSIEGFAPMGFYGKYS